jgi:flagellar motor switch protein FliN/FliY
MEEQPTEKETLDAILRKVQTTAPASVAKPFEDVEADASEVDSRRPRSELLKGVHLRVKVELGRTRLFLKDALELGPGSLVDLEKLAEDPVDLYVNDLLVARGEVLVVNDCFCIRVTEVLGAGEEQK